VVNLRGRFVVTRHGGSIVVKTWMRTKEEESKVLCRSLSSKTMLFFSIEFY
jgi:hypothetical protein